MDIKEKAEREWNALICLKMGSSRNTRFQTKQGICTCFWQASTLNNKVWNVSALRLHHTAQNAIVSAQVISHIKTQ